MSTVSLSAEPWEARTDLEGELGAAKVGLLLLPEVVRLDDERHADLGREELLQRLEQRLDELPLGAAHVDDDGEAAFAHVLAAGAETGEEPIRANQYEELIQL